MWALCTVCVTIHATSLAGHMNCNNTQGIQGGQRGKIGGRKKEVRRVRIMVRIHRVRERTQEEGGREEG